MGNLQQILMLLSGIGILLFSYLIGKKQKLYLVTSHITSIKNKDKVSKSLGNALGIIGIANISTPITINYLGKLALIIYSALVVISIIYIIRIYIKYM
ncbi:hypothetical protein RBU49_13905 [Clostridium sp. MB40-C1]|uniref:hypothetical protein n=1 Tax=Clostridium sp. MB40-C1 TaxID=3070996 RepID=UPI0027E1B75F|nr:hypothetical protein [Clostridium sp. MB40-C1]WMJ79951.1 hypothetical protein RBU49_13905 [Clostridium sp. MB40-C1]